MPEPKPSIEEAATAHAERLFQRIQKDAIEVRERFGDQQAELYMIRMLESLVKVWEKRVAKLRLKI